MLRKLFSRVAIFLGGLARQRPRVVATRELPREIDLVLVVAGGDLLRGQWVGQGLCLLT